MLKILIVDDESDVVELLSFILKKDDHEIHSAYNGRDALEQIGLLPSDKPRFTPDLVVLDVMMPEMDGYTVQAKMLEHEGTRSIPIIILTARGQMKELFGMASNVVSYLEKPFDPDVIRKKVLQIIDTIKKKEIR